LVIVVERGFVVAIGSSTAEVRAALNGGGAS
jgi:hypothetical protein